MYMDQTTRNLLCQVLLFKCTICAFACCHYPILLWICCLIVHLFRVKRLINLSIYAFPFLVCEVLTCIYGIKSKPGFPKALVSLYQVSSLGLCSLLNVDYPSLLLFAFVLSPVMALLRLRFSFCTHSQPFLIACCTGSHL